MWRSAHTIQGEGVEFVLLNGQYTDRLGVIDMPSIGAQAAVTNLERTLLDCVVRPQYCGGVFAVADAFARAREQLDVERLQRDLMTLNYGRCSVSAPVRIHC